jgi:putative IMPACT (imprinted ancient) family translation regulator
MENDLRASPYQLGDTRFDDSAHFEVGLAAGQLEPFLSWLADLTGGEARTSDRGERWVS